MTEYEMLTEALLCLSHMRRRVVGDPSLTEWVSVGLILADVVKRTDVVLADAKAAGLLVVKDVI